MKSSYFTNDLFLIQSRANYKTCFLFKLFLTKYNIIELKFKLKF
jgi:hypothetical protein